LKCQPDDISVRLAPLTPQYPAPGHPGALRCRHRQSVHTDAVLCPPIPSVCKIDGKLTPDSHRSPDSLRYDQSQFPPGPLRNKHSPPPKKTSSVQKEPHPLQEPKRTCGLNRLCAGFWGLALDLTPKGRLPGHFPDSPTPHGSPSPARGPPPLPPRPRVRPTLFAHLLKLHEVLFPSDGACRAGSGLARGGNPDSEPNEKRNPSSEGSGTPPAFVFLPSLVRVPPLPDGGKKGGGQPNSQLESFSAPLPMRLMGGLHNRCRGRGLKYK